MRQVNCLIFLLLFISSGLYGQEKIVSGSVKDARDGHHLSGVHILYTGGGLAISDDKGSFSFVCEGEQQEIEFRFVGYKTLRQKYTLVGKDSIFIEVLLDPAPEKIEEIVVSPGRKEQKLAELTISTSIVKHSQLTKNLVYESEELIEQVPGIEILDGQASIRGGSGFSYGAGSRVMSLVDGMPALSADAGNIKWHFLPLEMMSGVEVMKGASSVLYGSSALNGLINLRTRNAGDVPYTEISTMAGLYGAPAREEWKWWESPRFFSRASFLHTRKIGKNELGVSARLSSNMGYRKDNEDKYAGANIKFRHDAAGESPWDYGFLLSGGVEHSTDFLLWDNAETGGLIQNPASAMKFRGSMFSFDPWLSYSRNENSGHEIRARIQYTDNDLPDNPSNNSRAGSYYTEYNGHRRFFDRLQLLYGAVTNFGKVRSNFHGDHDSYSVAAYGQAEFRIVERLKLSAGLRLEAAGIDSLSGKLVPVFRTGINYRLAKYTYLRGSYGQGYRYPSIAEKYASTTAGALIVIPNPIVGPESGWNLEFGLKQGLSLGRFKGFTDISFFYTRNSDLIEYLFDMYPVPGDPGFVYGFMAHNVENSRVYGLEWEYGISRNVGRLSLSFAGGYTFVYPVEFDPKTGENTGNYLKYRRKHSYTMLTSAGYGKFELGLNLRARSGLLDVDDVFLDPFWGEAILPGFPAYWEENNKPYCVTDIRASFKATGWLNISTAVKNVFNVEYMGRPGDIMPPRNYTIQLTAVF